MQHKTQRYAAPVQHREPDAVDTSWDDLRAFLVCADQRSFRRAADVLGLTNTTMMRRLDRLEAELGFSLFVRHQSGLQLTDEGRTLLDDVRQMERISFNIFRRVAQTGVNPTGVVRVAVTEGVGTYWVMPKLIDFQRTYRMLTVDLRCAMEQADVTRLEADIAIQFEKPTDGDLIVTRLGRLHVYPFASQGLGEPGKSGEGHFHRRRKTHHLGCDCVPSLWSVSYLQSIVNHSLRRRFGERNIMVLRASKTPSMSQRGGLRHIVSNGETAGANVPT